MVEQQPLVYYHADLVFISTHRHADYWFATLLKQLTGRHMEKKAHLAVGLLLRGTGASWLWVS